KLNGTEVGTVKHNLKSDKSKKNSAKPNEEQAGKFATTSTTQSFTPTQEGTYTAELKVLDKVARYATKSITFTVGEGGSTPTPGGACSREFVSTGNGSTVAGTLTSASPSGSISSDNGVYNVAQGIPSSESLRADASSEEYLHDYNFTQKNGNVVFNNIAAEKTFTLTWTEETTSTGPDGKPVTVKTPKTETQVVKETVSGITRPYSYWEVMKYNIWQLTDSQFTNYALPGGSLTIPSGVSVSANATHSDVVEEHVFPAECPAVVLPAQTIAGGTTKPPVPSITAEAKSFAEGKIGQNQVQNDSATFKGSTIMNNSRTSVNGPTPSGIASPTKINMSRTGLQIDPNKTNYWQSPSTGAVNYSVVFSLDKTASSQNYPFSVNNVTVHTPVTIYGKSSDDKEHDQRINPPVRSTPANPDKDRHAYILDRTFTVSLPTNGQHRNIPGYGNRDYSKYIKEKQVKFPFDVYSETKQAFYPANTWISVPVNMETATFFLPVWNKEGEYTVEFRSFAINALTSGDFGGSEAQANVSIPNGTVEGHQSAAHVATDSIEVDIVGRMYDLAITDISDYNWKNTFRLADGITPSGNAYYVGQNGIDGALRGNTEKFTLPVHHGSDVKSIKNQAVKTGYSFSFNMKTKGDMESVKDAIRITPTFYHVNADGTNRQEVDLYYHQDKNYFIKIGSEKDTTYRTVTLNETTRNVPSNELSNNAIHYFDFANRFNLEDTAADYYASSFARHYLRTMSKEAIQTGPYGWQILNWKLRTLRGPLENEVPTNTVIPAKEIVSKEQTWYGEYSLPAETYVVPKGSNIEQTALMGNLYENHPIFLKEGYIIVNFKIETIQEGDLNNPYLAYYDAYYMSQWTDMEGFKSSFVDGYGNTFNLEEGDVMFYHADQTSLSDYNSSVTH
ncbi:TPA: hypothetical protein NJY08_004783, partial [Salmonella enterica subsp. enterica serovar Typhi str. AG3]|nr:hypothetical protein [Salmonella enterica subsp. enterica serovar Typhi str. AG3]